MKFITEYTTEKRRTNGIHPHDVPAIAQAIADKKRIVFCNSMFDMEGVTVLFEGCDMRNPISRNGRLLYKGEYYQYCYITE